jgi:hypothetical protein
MVIRPSAMVWPEADADAGQPEESLIKNAGRVSGKNSCPAANRHVILS